MGEQGEVLHRHLRPCSLRLSKRGGGGGTGGGAGGQASGRGRGICTGVSTNSASYHLYDDRL